MEQQGLRREGFFRECSSRGDDGWWDEYYYAILVEEWQGAAHRQIGPD